MAINRKCYICKQINLSGIYIKNQYICCRCEKEITEITHEQSEYEEYKEKIKRLVNN